ASAGHLRGPRSARRALGDAERLHREIQSKGFAADAAEIPLAVQARHLALASAAYLKAIVELLAAGSGSRGSHIVLDDKGDEIHADVIDKSTGKPLRFKPENAALRNTILQLRYEGDGAAGKDPFLCEQVPVREARVEDKAFEVLWREFREGNIYS
ncbi:MAG: hypothetical protein QGD94_13025, partial [Planctomycetia bacterium]|nr:hypothetical protein [Planctomycetia bacterium]